MLSLPNKLRPLLATVFECFLAQLGVRNQPLASMVCCQVLVEFGMTKPKWKFHSSGGHPILPRESSFDSSQKRIVPSKMVWAA